MSRSSRCRIARATGTGPTCNPPAASAWSTATVCISTSAAAPASPGTSMPGRCSTGLATLRRDGFVSLTDAWPSGSTRPILRHQSTMITRPVRFTGAHAFVNADVAGSIRVEMLDRDGQHHSAGSKPIAATPVSRQSHAGTASRWSGASLAGLANTDRAIQVRARSRPPLCLLGQPVAARREPRATSPPVVPDMRERWTRDFATRVPSRHGGVAGPAARPRGAAAARRSTTASRSARRGRRSVPTRMNIRSGRRISPIGRRWCRSTSAGSCSSTTS